MKEKIMQLSVLKKGLLGLAKHNSYSFLFVCIVQILISICMGFKHHFKEMLNVIQYDKTGGA